MLPIFTHRVEQYPLFPRSLDPAMMRPMCGIGLLRASGASIGPSLDRVYNMIPTSQKNNLDATDNKE